VNNPYDEDWDLLLSIFPMGWQEQAVLSGASERLRGFRSVADLLRVLLLHVGPGYSLRETVARARLAGWADVSDVALLKRLRKSRQWLRTMCVALLRESGWRMEMDTRGWNIRVLDGTIKASAIFQSTKNSADMPGSTASSCSCCWARS
jgi:hypothetical protein